MKIRNFVKRLSKRAKVFAAAGMVLGVLIPAAVYAGYGPNGPDRVIYDWNNPAEHNGAFDGPRFNSYINTDVYGDERAFLDAKECVTPGPACYTTGTAGGYKDQQPVQVGKEYIVRAYVHNIANPSINGTNNDGIGVAKDTMFKVEIPDGTANGFSLKATISASNSIPKSVYDTVDLRNDSQAFDVEYVADSAYISNTAHGEGLKLSDSVVTTGTLVGYDQMNGIWPGCFDFTAFVTIRVKIKAPALTIKKQVTTPGSTVWKENLDAKKGDTVSWLINYDVTGTTVNDITVRDPIPKGLTLVPGSITWFDPNHPSGEVLPDTALGAGGVNVGNYQAGSGGAIRFRTTVDSNKDDPCVIKNVAYGRAFNVSEKNDDAKVTRTDCVAEEPIYSCDLLEVNKIGGDRKYEFKAQYTAKNGATFKSFTYDFGDGTTPLTTNKATVDYAYAKDGSYATKVTVNFTVNGVDKSATSNACKKTINVTTPENCTVPGKEHLPKDSPECIETTTTTALPNTGPGDVVGLFAAATIAGALVHKFILGRRYS